MSDLWNDGLPLKIVNIAVYLLELSSTIYIVVSQRSDFLRPGKETYITPAPWVFIIWPLIHLLLLGTIVYQFFPNGKQTIINGISWHLPHLGILNIIYVNLWASQRYDLAFVLSLMIASIATQIYYVVKKHHVSESIMDELFIHLPFSLYQGWTSILVVLAAFDAFGVDSLHYGAGVWTKVSVFIVLFLLESNAAAFSFFTPEGDFPATVVISSFLWAVYVHQTSSGFVHVCSLVFAILSLVWVVKGSYDLFVRTRSGRISLDEEQSSPME